MGLNLSSNILQDLISQIFAGRKKRIVIELDGGQHNEIQNKINDDKRTEYLISKGYKVLRLWNNEIDNNIEGVYLKLAALICE